MKCLVLGGTRYFGKHLVERLIAQKAEVTLVSRGQTADTFGSAVKRITADRSDRQSLKQALQNQTWDVAYDQIGYSPDDARGLNEALSGRIGRLIFTSTKSVYDPGADIRENAFDAREMPIEWGGRESFDYQKGKRLAEAVYFQQATFPVTAVRIPIVLGPDDYTKRLHFHVERIKSGEEFYMPSTSARMCFITSAEAAKFLDWVKDVDVLGPINACAPKPIALGDLVSAIEKQTQRRAILAKEERDDNHSPFGIGSDWFMNVEKAQNKGFKFQEISEWLPQLVEEVASQIS